MAAGTIFHGTLIDAPTPRALRVRSNVYCVVTGGVIRQICDHEDGIRHEFRQLPPTELKGTQVLIPGLIDLHIHAPQFKQLGTKTDIPLMEWLQKYTFPAESAFSSSSHAELVYSKLMSHLIKNGTTTAVLYGSNHLEATKILADCCDKTGIRGFVGKTCADMLTPDYYVETTEGSLKDTEEFVKWCFEKWGSGREARVQPVITPRFIPTCSEKLLTGLGDIAQKYDCYVQSHAAESVDEELLVESQHPGHRDVEIYRRTGLLGDKTILAHCCRLKDAEAAMMEKTGSTVVSCPWSNILFARATVPIPRYQSMFPALKIGLGTDIAGGFGTMLDNMRTAILQDRVDSFATVNRASDVTETDVTAENWIMDFKYAFHLATASGAKALGLDDMIGKFEEGMNWDAVELDLAMDEYEIGGGGVDRRQRFTRFGDESIAELFEKWVTTGDDRNIRAVWVNGKECVDIASQ
ncbi:hypothetical protein H072_7002 [Dactylellina haptotyla CBS 200.50]|uniref:Amidohydrolase-related domain-containing protein n=1 Tax=Dactylellina haptotyla (strain CBS 200.50) TaxID=1284197 RepID=S8A8L0_DACHA|nr:hypothetical protein H072_7002 [Dactylellina haptotyla CBS 200.50]